MKVIFKFAVILSIILVFSHTFAQARQTKEIVNVDLNGSTYVKADKVITRITSGNPQIAIVKQVDPNLKTGFLVEGHGVGTTTILVWTLGGQIKEYMIVVSPEDTGQALLIQKAIGLPGVRVKKIGEKILLTGTVENQYERNYAIQVASFYVQGNADVAVSTGSNVALNLEASSSTSSSTDDIEIGKIESSGVIVDLLKMLHPTQVRLEAQVIDINSSNTKDLGFQYGYGYNSGTTITIAPGSIFAGESLGSGGNFKNNPAKWFEHHRTDLFMSLQALVETGKARILSRPSLTTMSGEQATIQIGGQIPYTTSNLAGTTVSFKNYGIILQCRPIVDDDNKITAAINAEVSNMSGQSIDGQPIITTRNAEAVISLDSGASMIIGGLMDSSESKTVSKIPFLGDIPVLGEFFKYSHKTRSKRELIIIITPKVIDPNEPADMTDEMKNAYIQGYQAALERQSVDLNSPPEIPEKKEKTKLKVKNKQDSENKPNEDNPDSDPNDGLWIMKRKI